MEAAVLDEATYQPKVVVPTTTLQTFDGVSRDCFLTYVEGKDYEVCERYSENNWGNKKPGAYGRGLSKTKSDPYWPARMGKIGEMAFAKVFNVPVDIQYREGGDRKDFLLCEGVTVDQKMAGRNYGCSLVYCVNEKGRKVPVEKDIYVGSYLEDEDRVGKRAIVVMVGFAFKEEVLVSPKMPGRKGAGHYNYEVAFAKMHPTADLLTMQRKYQAAL